MRTPHTVHPYATEATSAAARNTRSAAGQAAVDDPEAARPAFADGLAAGPEVAELMFAAAGLVVDQRFWWSVESARRQLQDTVPADW